MPRIRSIKHGFYTNDTLAECEPLARLLFPGLWILADRDGRLEDRPKRIKAELLPYDECDVESLLAQLAKYGFIYRYQVDGAAYIQIATFSRHQKPHAKEAKSIIPPPPSYSPPEQIPDEPENAGKSPGISRQGSGQALPNPVDGESPEGKSDSDSNAASGKSNDVNSPEISRQGSGEPEKGSGEPGGEWLMVNGEWLMVNGGGGKVQAHAGD